MGQPLSDAETDRVKFRHFTATEKVSQVPEPKWDAREKFEAAQTSFVDGGQTKPQQTPPPQADPVPPQQSTPPYPKSFFDDGTAPASQNQVNENVWESEPTPRSYR